MQILIDGDFVARRWRNREDVKSTLLTLIRHLYSLRSFPKPYEPPDRMGIAFSHGTWRLSPYKWTEPKQQGELLSIADAVGLPVLREDSCEAVDLIAATVSPYHGETVVVSGDPRIMGMWAKGANTLTLYKPGLYNLAGKWLEYSESDWHKQYRSMCKHWASYITCLGFPGLKGIAPTHAAAAKQAAMVEALESASVKALPGITVPDVSPSLRAVLLEARLEEIADMQRKLDQERYYRVLNQFRHEVDPKQPIRYPAGSIEAQVIKTLREENELPLYMEGDMRDGQQ